MTRENFIAYAGRMVDDLEKGDFVLFRCVDYNEDEPCKDIEIVTVIPENKFCEQKKITVRWDDYC